MECFGLTSLCVLGEVTFCQGIYRCWDSYDWSLCQQYSCSIDVCLCLQPVGNSLLLCFQSSLRAYMNLRQCILSFYYTSTFGGWIGMQLRTVWNSTGNQWSPDSQVLKYLLVLGIFFLRGAIESPYNVAFFCSIPLLFSHSIRWVYLNQFVCR